MKNLLLFVSFVICTNSLFANPRQGNWRWRFDNGSETTATWQAAENTPVIISTNQTLRLRTQIFADAFITKEIHLQYASSLNPTVWIDITNTAGSNAFELAGYSRNITDNTVTTEQLAGCSEAYQCVYQAGTVFVSTEVISKTFSERSKSDFEWTITPTINLQPSVTYTFRVANVEYPMALPSLTTASTLPVELTSFVVKTESNKARLQWTTQTELNNDYFEVERSADGRSWTAIGKVKGSGTTTDARTYTAYDFSPLSGTNFYRISQHDFDGRVKISSVVSLKFSSSAMTNISTYPNPTTDGIRFTLNNVNEKELTASLISLDGKLVHRQNIVISATSNLYQLDLQRKPAPGTYILSLRGNNTSLNGRVLVR